MNMRVTNEKITIKQIDLGGVGASGVVLIGDAEVITSSSIFDTPADSVIQDPRIPIVTGTGEKEKK